MSNKNIRFIIIWVLIIATVYVGNNFIRNVFLTSDAPRAIIPRGDLAEYEKTTMELFKNSSPSVVYLFTGKTIRGLFGTKKTQQGAGSGFLWDRAGHIVTNYHVVAGAREIKVKLDSGLVADAVFVGGSPAHDLAVVRLLHIPSMIMPIPLGDSDKLKVGQAVFAIGNPFGLSRTLTTGVISAINRRITTFGGSEMVGVIQTDAAINPGNSGGPLLDSASRLIGINTSIISTSGNNAGIGFAVPVNIINEIIPKLIKNGRVPKPGIGIEILSEENTAKLGIIGIVISKVFAGSTAKRAGLSGIDYRNGILGDVIVAVNGTKVTDFSSFHKIISKQKIGDIVSLTIQRNRKYRKVKIRIMDIEKM